MSTPPLPEGLTNSPLHEVANRLHSTAIHLLRDARAADVETGLSPERLSLLSVLVYGGPCSLGRLADAEQVSRPAISRTVKALVADGLVRTVRNREDRRSVTASATDKGRRLMEAGRRRRLERIAARLGGFTSEELHALRRAAEILERAG
jgi:DNA-binding MarR family transcriptional regulator